MTGGAALLAAPLAALLLLGGGAAAAPGGGGPADAVLLEARRLAAQGDPAAALGRLEERLAQPGLAAQDGAALHLEAARQSVAARDRDRGREHLARLGGLLPALAGTPGLVPRLQLRMGQLAQALGDPRQAEALLAAAAPALAPVDPAAGAEAGNALGLVRLELQRPADAARAFRQALGLRGLAREAQGRLLVNLADAELQAGQDDQAAATLARAEAQGGGTAARGAALLVRAQLLLSQARLLEAEALLERAGARDSPFPELRGHALMLLARAQFDRGRMPEAARTGLAAVAAYQESLGDWQPALARAYHLLGNAYGELHDRVTAKAFFARAVEIEAAAFGPRSPQAQATQLEWAWIELQDGEREAAGRRAAAAAAVLDPLEGSNPRLTGLSRVMTGLVAEADGRNAEAVRRYREAQDLIGRAGEASKADRGFSLVRLGRLLTRSGQLEDAVAPLDEAIALYLGLGSAGTTRLADALVARAELRLRQGDRHGALETGRRAYAILRERLGAGQDGEDGTFRRGAREVLADHARLLLALHAAQPEPALLEEAFAATQDALASRAGEALRQAMLRQAAGNAGYAALLREQSEAADRLAQLAFRERAAAQQAGPRAAEEGERLRREEARQRQALGALDARLQATVPGLAAYVTPQPVSIRAVQAAVAADAVVVATLATDDGLLVWAITREAVRAAATATPDTRIAALVGQLRAAVDPRLRRVAVASRGGEAAGGLSPGERILVAWRTRSGLAPDTEAAAEGDGQAARRLYDAVLGPVSALLEGKRRLVFVPDGALQSIPPSMLVGGEPAGVLARRFAVTVMPSIASLAVVPGAPASRAGKAFLGVGNPHLPGGGAPAEAASSALWRSLSALEPVPETEAELTRIAGLFPGPANTTLLLGDHATKAAIARAGPAQFRIVAFATHAVMAGNLPGIAEPAVVLTPDRADPAAGLLTASDIAAMALDADLVLLSACNTAAPDGGPYAEGLSGLARAFLHAGARSLLVSHWAVDSLATARLMTRFMAALQADPARDKAAALQATMLSFLDGSDPGMRDAAIWAPFVVVGP